MPEALIKRRLYENDYRSHLEEPVTQPEKPANPDEDVDNTSSADPENPEERSWKKRYGDLRSFNSKLTDEVKTLKAQLLAAQKKEVQIPSSKEEIDAFAQRYPDIFRHIRSIAMAEILSQKQDLAQETEVVRENLQKITREAAEAKIKKAHPDFEELNNSEEFHMWAQSQSKAIQSMIYDSSDPDDCISALDLYKAQTRKKPGPKPRSNGADTLVQTKTPTNLTDEGGKRIWKASEIGALKPAQFEKFEAEIEQARIEGRIDMTA